MSWRTAPLPPDWPRTARRILKRDRHKCYVCGAKATEVDHVVPASKGGTDDDSNLRSICRRCHRAKTGREGQARSPFRSAKRPAEPHPGLLGGGEGPPFDPQIVAGGLST
jgi:5-methylcytosine-specific restriction endonuclease McrA